MGILKDDLKAKLDELGIAYDNRAKNEDLEELLPKGVLEKMENKGADAPEPPKEPAPEPAAEGDANADPDAVPKEPAPEAAPVAVSAKGTVTKPEKGADAVDIVRLHEEGDPEYIRTYSEDQHGKDFMKCAESFVSGAMSKRKETCVIAKHNKQNPAIV